MNRGWQAWATLATCALQHGFLISIVYTSPSVLLPILRDEFGLTVREVALPLVAYKAAVIFLLPLAGWALDWAGLRVCLVAGTIVTAMVGLIFAVAVQSLASFVIVQALASVGYVLAGTAVTVLMANTWWESRLGMSTGIVLGSAAVMSSVTPLVIEIAVEGWSWRGAVGLQACLFGVVVLPLVLLFGSPKTKTHEKARGSGGGGPLNVKVLRSADFWMLSGVYFLSYFQIGIVFEHLLLYLQEGTSISRETSSILYSVLNLSVFLGKVVGGLAADMGENRYQSVVLSSLVMALSAPLLFHVPGVRLQLATDPWQLGVFSVLYGAAFGTMFNGLFALVPSLFESSELGFVQSSLASVYYMSSLMGSLLAALVHDWMDGYCNAFMLVLLAAVGNFLLCAYFSNRKRAGSVAVDDPAAELLLLRSSSSAPNRA